MEQTYVMIKPDGVQRGLIGDIVSRIEQKGLRADIMQNTSKRTFSNS
jgi:nucleoside-diphosphate kinase